MKNLASRNHGGITGAGIKIPMIKCTMEICRIYVKRYERLKKQGEKLKNKEKSPKFEENLNNVEKQKNIYKKKAEQYLDTLDLISGEKEVAKYYYIEAQSWSNAFSNSTMEQELSLEALNSNFEDNLLDATKKKIYRVMDESRLSQQDKNN